MLDRREIHEHDDARPIEVSQREVLFRSSKGSLPRLIIGIAILIAFGGGTHPLSLGLLTFFLGLIIISRPPEYNLGKFFGFCWLALLIWIVSALWLPAPSVDWRLAAESLAVPISSSISPQPWVSLEALIGFLAGSVLLVIASDRKPDFGQRQHGIHLLSAALTALGIGAILAASFGWRLPWANEVHVFSWLPNRNQTALVFACGSVLSFGLAIIPWYRVSQGCRYSWITVYKPSLLAMVSGGILLYAVFLSLSKGALIAWSFGMLALGIFFALSPRRFGNLFIRVLPALLILLFSFFAFMGGDSRDRMMETIASFDSETGTGAIPLDLRWEIYSDTLPMIADQAWTGVGVGQFQYVFPQYRTIPAAPVGILHPESDWLWWAAELGMVGLVIIVVGFGALLYRLRQPNQNNDINSMGPTNPVIDRLYRQIALAAVIPFFVHSLVDVGAHRLGTVSLAIVLYVLALPQRSQNAFSGALARRLWRSSGGALLLIGIGLISLSAAQSPLLTKYAATAQSPLATTPLQWQPYFRRAVQLYSNNPKAALDTFYQVRFLRPDNADIPLQEGLFLLRMNDNLGAFAAFTSAIERSRSPLEPFRKFLGRTASKPSNHAWLHRLAQSDSELIAAYWCAIPTETLRKEESMLSLSKEWHILPAAAQNKVLNNLSKRKFNKEVLRLFNSSLVNKQKEIWPAAMKALLAEDRWEEALVLFDRWAERKSLPDDTLSDDALSKLQATALVHLQDPIVATRLVHAYISREMWDEARRTAERARLLPESPTDLVYWQGYALFQTNRREEAAKVYAEWLTLQSEKESAKTQY